MDLLQCVSWSFHTEDPADGRLHHAAPPLNLKPHHHRGLSCNGALATLTGITAIAGAAAYWLPAAGLVAGALGAWAAVWAYRIGADVRVEINPEDWSEGPGSYQAWTYLISPDRAKGRGAGDVTVYEIHPDGSETLVLANTRVRASGEIQIDSATNEIRVAVYLR